jgi:hypothetical protein
MLAVSAVASEFCDADVTLGSSSDSAAGGHSHGAVSRSRKSAMSNLRTKSWRSSSSVGSFNVSVSRGQSIDLDSSSTTSSAGDEVSHSTGALPRRRSSALHGTTGVSSRRGSALQGQSSVTSDGSCAEFGGYSRRRSSGLSEVSLRSSSSSGKRSSTDFSSETEDYFDGLQQHHSLAAAVIEEENGGLHEATVARMDTILEDIRRDNSGQLARREDDVYSSSSAIASREPLTTAVNQLPGHSLLEHFVDNLINEAAQDSRFEIESYVCQQQYQTDPSESSHAAFPARLESVRAEMAGNLSTINGNTPTCREGIKYSCSVSPATSEVLKKRDLYYEAFANNITMNIISSALETVISDSLPSVIIPLSSAVDSLSVDISSLDDFAACLSEAVCHEALNAYRRVVDVGIDALNAVGEGSFSKSELSHVLQSKYVSSVASDKLNKSPHLMTPTSDRSKNMCWHDLGKCSRSEQRHIVSRFKNSVLSDFEDELIRSSTSSPGMLLFSDIKRRSSEPALSCRSAYRLAESRRRNCHVTSISLCESDLQNCTSAISGHREFVNNLFSEDYTSEVCRTAVVNLDEYAQNLVCDAFLNALTDIRHQTTASSTGDASDVANLSRLIVQRALNEAADVITASSVRHHAVIHDDSDLLSIATDFAQQIVNEAAQIHAQTPALVSRLFLIGIFLG